MKIYNIAKNVGKYFDNMARNFSDKKGEPSNNRQSQNSTTDIPENTYRDLAPTDSISDDQEYIKALHWAINNKRVKNIALTGPYGSGKSSIISSYLKAHRFTC